MGDRHGRNTQSHQIMPNSRERRWQVVPPQGTATALRDVLDLASGPDPGTKPVTSRSEERTLVHYSRTRVWLDRDAWEALAAPGDVLVQRVRYPGRRPYTIALTRSELERVFGEVRESRSWDDVRCYHFQKEPPAIEAFRVASRR
jgi:hypothetical protein